MERFSKLWRPLIGAVLIFAVLACSGGGCSGCEACGIAPIPGGFPLAERIPNSAQVRLTESGLAFFEDNISEIVPLFLPGGLDFAIPRTSGSTSGIDYDVCRSSDCMAHAEIADLELIPTAPNAIRAVVQIIIDSRDTAGARRPIPVRVDPPILPATTCQADLDTRRGSREFIAVTATIVLAEETEPARAGYTRIDVTDFALVEGQSIEDADVDIGGCSGFTGFILNLLLPIFRGTLIDQLTGQLSSLADGLLGDQLCTQQGEFGCPTGTFPDGPDATDICRFGPASSDRCVPSLIGIEGRGDLGAQFLGGFSPGTHGSGQIVLASGGEGEAVNGGMSLFMVGGFQSTDRTYMTSPGHNPCVPLVEPPPLPDIARAEGFRGNVIPGTSTATHIGIGIAEDYLDYAGYGMFDSGMLCLGAGTRLSQQLSTGLLSAVVPSVRQLTFPASSAPVTIAVRPQRPPDFTIGTDAGAPTLSIALPELQLDFYVWSTERYVRFLTYQTDMTIAIDLSVEGGELVPRIRSVEALNSTAFNSELITEQPAAVASAVETVITSFADMLAGALSPFALPEIMGFELDVPDDGVRGVADSGEAFLGIFANLRLATAMPLTATPETSVRVGEIQIDRESLTLEGWGRTPTRVEIDLSADGPLGVEYEYSYRIDHMTWSRWSPERHVTLDHPVLLLQGRHVLEARARVAGESHSADQTPATANIIIDLEAPEVSLERDADGYMVHARDLVSSEEDMRYRYRILRGDGIAGEWSEWTHSGLVALPEDLPDGSSLEVEVMDEADNVGTTRQAIIRGLPNPAGGGACNCRVPGHNDRGVPLAFLVGLALAGLAFSRRRSKRTARATVTIGLAVGMLLIASGCDCAGPTMGLPCGDMCSPARPPGITAGTICCESTDMCSPYDSDGLCASMPGHFCPTDSVVVDELTCGVSCSACMAYPALLPGLLATDLDFTVRSSSVIVSGYSPGDAPSTHYGDLVVGEVSGTSVDWEIVDGAPSGPITNDPAGWRGGVSAEGDDVGRWTSMADDGTNIYIAYYDATNGALKIAIGAPGAWSIHTVDDAGDSGRYASIALTGSGAPAIAYTRLEADATTGELRGSAQVAVASGAVPGGPTDWTITELGFGLSPCRPDFCATGMSCLESGACVTPGAGCAMCGTDQVCFMGECQTALPQSYVEDMPPAYGLYTSLAATPGGGLVAVWYDRSAGNLYGAEASAGGAFGAPLLIDGYLAMDPNTGDSGLGNSVFVDAGGTWHVSYVDGAEETIRYATVTGGAVTARSVVDDGATDGMAGHADGRHVVGDDSSIVVTDAGEVRIVYQDATVQQVMLARRGAGGGDWTITVLDDMNHSGFWVSQRLVGTQSTVVTWWRQQMRAGSMNGVRVLSAD